MMGNTSGIAETARADRLFRMVEPEPEPEQRGPQSEGQQGEAGAEGDPEAVEDVGMGWSKVTEDDGAVFYWHADSEESQWEPPAHVSAPAPAPAPAALMKRQPQTISGTSFSKLPPLMERSEDEQRRSPDPSTSAEESDESSGVTPPPPPEAAEAAAAAATAAPAAAAAADNTSEVKHMMARGKPVLVLSSKAQPLREPLPRQMYRGSNSDTQLTWGTKVAWADEGAGEDASGSGNPDASPTSHRSGSGKAIRKSSSKTIHWEEWTVDEVQVWLANLDVDVKECADVFKTQRVKGKHLKKLDDDLLEKLGIVAFGDRETILEARDNLSQDQERIRVAAAARATGSTPRSPMVMDLSDIKGAATPSRLPPSTSAFPGAAPPPSERKDEPQVLVGANGGDPLVVYTERPLGGGAAGSVFEGWYQGQFVAVKRMNETEKQAVKELDIYRNSAANRHPNLIFTHGFKVEHGLVYLIMDRCDCSLSVAGGIGKAFVTQLRSTPDLPRELCKQLLAGVSQLHSLHVIHRDLKPSNVLVREATGFLEAAAASAAASGEKASGKDDTAAAGAGRGKKPRHPPQLCLCDMGLSKRQSANYSISTLGDDVGTLGWRAPELRKAGAQATEASDVYTTGLIIYYILTGGCHVFDDDEDERVAPNEKEWENDRQQAHLTYARQEAIDEIGREWERVQKYGSRTSTTTVFALSTSHRDLLSTEKEAEREQLIEALAERLGIHRVHALPPGSPVVNPMKGLMFSDNGCASIAEISTEAVSLLSRLLHPDPKKRPTAGEALADSFFQVVLEGQDQIAEGELTIGGVIGDGAMGIVYHAKWRETDVAVKRLKRTDGSSSSSSQSTNGGSKDSGMVDFVREVALLKRLRHPHVVLWMGWFLSSSSYLAADVDHESLCFVTELCWTSLYHLLHSSTGGGRQQNVQHLHWARRLAMCLDAAKGMLFLHGEGIIHRDLKSANLLVDRSYRVKVCDFGLARTLGSTVGESRREVGTPQYDAPEVIVEGKPADIYSDVYSFGVVLWEVALLRKPYGDLAARVGASGALFCSILESYRQDVGLPMADWPTAESEAGGDAGGGAVALIGGDLKQLVESCLILKHTKREPRPTFEAIAAALGAMLQKLRHQANMERREAERNQAAKPSGQRSRLGGGMTMPPRREQSSGSGASTPRSGGDSPGLPASPMASQRGGVMTPLAPITPDGKADAGVGGGDGGAAPPSVRPPFAGGRRSIHTRRAAPGTPVSGGSGGGTAVLTGPSPTPPGGSPSGGPRVPDSGRASPAGGGGGGVTTTEAARRAARDEED